MLFINIKDKIPSNSHYAINESLSNATKEQENAISLIELKNPIIGLIMSIFLGIFGADRFYKGDVLQGVIKLGLFVAYLIFMIIGAIVESDEVLGIGMIFMIVDYTWAIIDIFLVFKGIKKDNLLKIQNTLLNPNRMQ